MTLDDIQSTYSLKVLDEKPEKGDGNVFVFDASRMQDKETALAEIYKVLNFKDYLPYANYDGLEELMAPDLWPDSKGLVLQFINAVSLEHMKDEELESILSIFLDAVRAWTACGKGLELKLYR